MSQSVTAPLKYSADELELALNILAMEGGRPTRASELLATQGLNVPKETLQHWKTRWADRYHQICDNLQDERAQRMAAQAEDVALRAAELELLLLEDLRNKRADLKAPELAGAVRNVTTTKTLNVEKVINPLRGRPSRITEVRDADEILKSLEAKLPKAITTTAEEVKTSETPTQVLVAQQGA